MLQPLQRVRPRGLIEELRRDSTIPNRRGAILSEALKRTEALGKFLIENDVGDFGISRVNANGETIGVISFINLRKE
jgi:hypothetical protein